MDDHEQSYLDHFVDPLVDIDILFDSQYPSLATCAEWFELISLDAQWLMHSP